LVSAAIALDRMLVSQGFGTRRACRNLIRHGLVTVLGEPVTDPDLVPSLEGLHFTVNDEPWEYRERVVLMLNKPAGMECSRNASAHASVFELLPAPLIARGVQPVGRLDQDTTGLLLLTDDGTLNHRLTSPRHHVPKLYHVTTKHPVDAAQIERLEAGVVLHDAPEAVAAQAVIMLSDHVLALTIEQGKYHQVKRMVAAAGNRVEALHRAQIGRLRLPDDLTPGTWRYVTDEELLQLV
jgi:16S rRNA pseudouridine516 synthase